MSSLPALTRDAGPRFGAIDIGSNTVHLLVASCPPRRLPIPLFHHREFVQLGLDVSRQGAIGEERLGLAIRALRRQVDDARKAQVDEIAIGATEALRAASNGAEVAKRLGAVTGGGAVHVLPSQVEAQLTFDGATMTVAQGRSALVLDIGGASSQVAWGPAGGVCQRASLRLGSGSLAAMATSEPPDASEWDAMVESVSRGISLPHLGSTFEVALGTGGTVTNLPRLLGLDGTQGLTRTQVGALIKSLAAEPAPDLARRTGMALERARLCRGGTLILVRLMELLSLERIRIAERGLRDGMIAALVRAGEGWWRAEPGRVPGGAALSSAE
ncbi:MAG: hypothetical protein ACREOL_07450 [Candidatus Dormibacteria bacterium]